MARLSPKRSAGGEEDKKSSRLVPTDCVVKVPPPRRLVLQPGTTASATCTGRLSKAASVSAPKGPQSKRTRRRRGKRARSTSPARPRLRTRSLSSGGRRTPTPPPTGRTSPMTTSVRYFSRNGDDIGDGDLGWRSGAPGSFVPPPPHWPSRAGGRRGGLVRRTHSPKTIVSSIHVHAC